MTQVPACVNCGDPAPDGWLCSVCAALKNEAIAECLKHRISRGDQVAAAVYAALSQYSETRRANNYHVTNSPAETTTAELSQGKGLKALRWRRPAANQGNW